MKNFHVPLPEELYDRLRVLSRDRGRPATVLVRDAVAEWIDRAEQERIAQEIAEYAAAEAGGPNDLDEALERASLDHLADEPT